MKKPRKFPPYFPSNIPFTHAMWEKLNLSRALNLLRKGDQASEILFLRQVADSLNHLPERAGLSVHAGLINLYGLQARIFRYIIDLYDVEQRPGALADATSRAGYPYARAETVAVLGGFARSYPGLEIIAGIESPSDYVAGDDKRATRKNTLVRELILLLVGRENPALDPFRELFDDYEMSPEGPSGKAAVSIDRELLAFPPFGPLGMKLPEILRAPLKAAPHSLAGQMAYIRENWQKILPKELIEELLISLDIIAEEERVFLGGPGLPQVMAFGPGGGPGGGPGTEGHEYPEPERFSLDADWMANVVMIAKMTYVWLGQLSKKYGWQISRLDQIPDEELDLLSRWGFTGLWLIGLWERSPASQKIKQIGGNTDAISSAYSLYDYTIAGDLGGEYALSNLKERCRRRGIRLASDMVPNHTGIYSKWTVDHPDWFIQVDQPPYPDYHFTGADLSFSPEISLWIEDGYWSRDNAAVVFKHHDHRDGRTRYIYHGNDGTSTPWNDTAQLNYLIPAVREEVVQTILHVARQFSIIRFDAAMTLAKKHYQRLWFPQPGHGSGIPSRAVHGMSRVDFDAVFPEEFWREVVDRVAAEVPDTLLLAEAFWLMEGYFVRTLGMHRVYNSAFMNMLKMEENAKYRQTLKNILEYDHRILQRFVNFMNNPDEKTAVEQFGKEGKYFGVALMLVTLPGLPMFGHGQVEGFHEKYGMEYKRAYWDEPVDEHLVGTHEDRIFPLMRRRRLFSGSDNFVLYDFYADGVVNEEVFAYSNRVGNERGIILFHNRYATTSGWIRISAAMGVKDEKGDTVLIQKSLGEALGFNPDGRCYYTFRDYVTGLEYLRSGRELCEDGLREELSAYEYRAFLDFKEIIDDEYGTWGRLCHRLDGRPAASLADALKLVRHGEVIEKFKAAAEKVALFLAGPELDETGLEMLLPLVQELYQEIRLHTGSTGDPLETADDTVWEVEGVIRLRCLTAAPKEGAAAEAEVSARENLLLASYLLLNLAGNIAPAEDYARVSAAWFEELGFDLAFGELLREDGASGETARDKLLMELMLLWQGFFADRAEEETGPRFRFLFGDRSAAAFLGVNSYGGTKWFNRERFEILMDRLSDAGVAWLAADIIDPELLLAAVSKLQTEIKNLKETAAAAGYSVERFILLLTGGDVLPEQEVSGIVGED